MYPVYQKTVPLAKTLFLPLLSVFFSCGEAASDVPLLLVEVQHLSGLGVKLWVNFGKPLSDVFVYCGFGDAEVTGAGSDGRAGFNHVQRQLTLSLADGLGHSFPSDSVADTLYAAAPGNIPRKHGCKSA